MSYQATSWTRNLRNGAYLSALFSLGMTAGLAHAQAVDPVNINGAKKPIPDAAVPSTAPATPPVSAGKNDAPISSGAGTPPTTNVQPAGSIDQPNQAVTPPTVTTHPPTPPIPAPVAPPEVTAPPVTPPPTPPAIPPTAATTPASALDTQPATQTVRNDKTFLITGLKINYYKDTPGEPPIETLLNTPVKLGVSNDAYTAPKPGAQIVTIKLADIGKQNIGKISRSGIEAVYGQIVRFFNEKGIIGVFVVVDSKDIDSNDNNIRPADRTTLQFIVVTSRVRQIRTLATGDTKGKDRVDLPEYNFIKARSPLKSDGTPDGHMDLLNKDVLDNYVLRLNRQPGRRVDVAVSGTDQPGEVNLDYLVSENRPWYAYTSISNTGTRQTSDWRERFGFVDNQLTGHDDILTLDYLTAGFSESHAVTLAYELPVFNIERLRYKIYSTYNQFTASDVGQNQENFTGEEWTVGNEVVYNFFQHREFFLDAVGGFRYQHDETNNATSGVNGEAGYFIPYAGLRLNRATDLATSSASATILSYNTSASQSQIEGLGRTDPTKNPFVLQFDASQSAYLEPLLDPEGFASGKSTLAHEVYVGVRGQYAFDGRLFPQAEDVAGGFYSVRGYPESIVAGDSVVIATAEYRFHIPRILPIQSDPTKTPFLWDKSFRFSPSQTYGRPDWDLITRAFVDVGEVINDRPSTLEQNNTLVGTGVGLELQYKQHLNLRVDWGVALTDIPGQVREGSNRFHISATLLY